MDKHFLLLLLSLSLLLGVLQGELLGEFGLDEQTHIALVCYKCDNINADGSCATNQSTCEARTREACKLYTAYEGNRFVYGYQRCQYQCRHQDWTVQTLHLVTTCCNENFCNRFVNLSPPPSIA
ncbi:PREDICTED: prostate and testis expressed protein 4-like [Elephantulus edwardii]|uniref:prostate and testis expressed protein 4-like n=1 Tax=Elephantulus edwardii TaxID=28737 RepID=UPI0003F08028|nr:PREDICTED: prostate and testis expressed protein 4-like [Elephantulus edwardii]